MLVPPVTGSGLWRISIFSVGGRIPDTGQHRAKKTGEQTQREFG